MLADGAYTVEAVHRTAYALMATVDVQIASLEPSIVCSLIPLNDGADLESLELNFRRELTDQQLRIAIEQRTDQYRDLILGLAFSRTGLQGG